MLDELDGRLEIVKEAVDVGEEDLDGAAGAEKVGDFDDRDEVGAVGTAGCCCACLREISYVGWWVGRGDVYPSRFLEDGSGS